MKSCLAFGFAPFKAEQLVSRKTLDTIYLKMVALTELAREVVPDS